MDLWSAAWVRHRLDRAKPVTAAAIGHRPTEPLKIGVRLIVTRCPRMMVTTKRAALPDLNHHAAPGTSLRSQNRAEQVGHLAAGDIIPTGDPDQIGI